MRFNNEKKYLALIIILLILLGAYVGFYAYVKVIVIPDQINQAKQDLRNMDMDINSYNKTSTNTSMNGFQNIDLNLIPISQRKEIADQMRTNPNQRIDMVDKLSTDNPLSEIYFWMYYLVFEGDAADDMKEIFSHNAVENNSNQFIDIMGTKIPDDIEKGDNKAVAADYLKVDELLKEMQQMKVVNRNKTQKFIDDLGG